MKTRILAAIPIAIILIAALIFQSWLLFGLVIVLSFIAQHEILCAVSAKGEKAVAVVPYVFCAAVPAILYFIPEFGFELLMTALVLAVIVLFLITMFSKKYDYRSFRNSLVALIYPEIFFIFIYMTVFKYASMEWIGANPYILLLGIFSTIFCDSAAYFVGRAIGRHKLCPELSPKKTVEGAVGGAIGGVVAGFLIWLLFGSGVTGLSYDMPLWLSLVLGAAVAFISQFGDLSASFIKRHYGIKDFGKLIPGHGGILDRIDSMLFAITALYIIMYFMDLAHWLTWRF